MEQSHDWEHQSAAGEPLFPRTRFVVVDELPEVSDQIKRLLVANGIDGEICANGNEALSILRRSELQVVLCNTNLPDREGRIGLKPASCNR
jgi:DNA-binding response OmpR family regulator